MTTDQQKFIWQNLNFNATFLSIAYHEIVISNLETNFSETAYNINDILHSNFVKCKYTSREIAWISCEKCSHRAQQLKQGWPPKESFHEKFLAKNMVINKDRGEKEHNLDILTHEYF